MVNRFIVVALALLAALGGVLLTAANGWGAGGAPPCRDTVTSVVSLCVRPQSPLWALALGALLPAAVVTALALAWLRRSRAR